MLTKTTYDRLKKIVFGIDGNKIKESKIFDSKQYSYIYNYIMNDYEKENSKQLVSLIQQGLTYEQIKNKMKRRKNTMAKKKKNITEIEETIERIENDIIDEKREGGKKMKNNKKSEQKKKTSTEKNKRDTVETVAEEIDSATDEKIFMYTNLKNKDIPGVDITFGRKTGSDNIMEDDEVPFIMESIPAFLITKTKDGIEEIPVDVKNIKKKKNKKSYDVFTSESKKSTRPDNLKWLDEIENSVYVPQSNVDKRFMEANKIVFG